MDAIAMIKERHSIRKFTDEKVSHDLIREIVDIARFAPSWANFQIARYTIIDDHTLIQQIGAEAVHGFAYNIDTLKNAPAVAVLSYVKGKSGKLDPTEEGYATAQGEVWEMFDAGIACQTFCLAAHAKGIGTCIFGMIDDDTIAKIAKLPEGETVAAVIVFGHPDGPATVTKRKPVDAILRFTN